MDLRNKEEISELQEDVIQQRRQEQQALAAHTSDALAALNISINGLPLKSQNLLQRVSQLQAAMDVDYTHSASTFYKHSNLINTHMELELSVLELKQKNAVLKNEVDRNEKFIEGLKRDLRDVKESLNSQNPNPDTLPECTREAKQKLALYEESYEKAKLKYSTWSVPPCIHPPELHALSERLAARRAEEAALAQRADDVTLAKHARDTLHSLTHINS